MINTSRVILALDNNQPMDEFNRLFAGLMMDCLGAYTMDDGELVLEDSYLVDWKTFESIKAQGMIDNQESVLVIPSEGEVHRQPSYLLYPNGDEVMLGKLTEIHHDSVKDTENWTYVKETGKFYTCL